MALSGSKRAAPARSLLTSNELNAAVGYPADAPCALRVSRATSDDRHERDRFELHRLREQSIEEQAAALGAAAVEAEGELVEVEVELAGADRALVGAEQPALQQRGHPVRARHDDVGGVAAGGNAGRVVREAGCREPVVTAPAVGVDERAGHGDIGEEAAQNGCGAVGDAGQPGSATGSARTDLGRDRDDRLLAAATERAGRLRAYKGLVDLDLTGQLLTAGTDHRSPQLVQQRPRALVAAQAEQALQTERAHPVLGAGQVPRGGEPGRERQPRVREDRPSRDRAIRPAVSAAEIATLAHPPGRAAATSGAEEAARPAQPGQIAQARLIARKPGVELAQRPRIVTAGKGSFHPTRIAPDHDGIRTKGRDPDSPHAANPHIALSAWERTSANAQSAPGQTTDDLRPGVAGWPMERGDARPTAAFHWRADRSTDRRHFRFPMAKTGVCSADVRALSTER